MSAPLSRSTGGASQTIADDSGKDNPESESATNKVLPPVHTSDPSHSHPVTGVSDYVAQEARDFMLSSTRRMSDSHSPRSPGLTNELMDQTHLFWDSTATRRESHSKYLPDVTLPGVTDEVTEEALEFMEGVETQKE